VQPNKVYVGGLPEHTRQEDLQSCFGKLGSILNIELKYVVHLHSNFLLLTVANNRRQSRIWFRCTSSPIFNWAGSNLFVQEFDTRDAAEESVAKYHEGYFMGNKIRVELSHGGGRTAKYSGDPGACFKCGQMGHWARLVTYPV
jgi:RNA recognition motif-containing protein